MRVRRYGFETSFTAARTGIHNGVSAGHHNADFELESHIYYVLRCPGTAFVYSVAPTAKESTRLAIRCSSESVQQRQP